MDDRTGSERVDGRGRSSVENRCDVAVVVVGRRGVVVVATDGWRGVVVVVVDG